jgi:negative regulator of sigma E activity
MKEVSALMDGELDARQARSTIVRVEDEDELRDAWATFHVIRDTLQGNAIGPSRFTERFHDRLAHEPAPSGALWRSRLPRPATALWIVTGALVLLALLYWSFGAGREARERAALAPVASGVHTLNSAVAIEYAMEHRQLVPTFVVEDALRAASLASPPAAEPAAAAKGATK